jgi:taurine dioxygenase
LVSDEDEEVLLVSHNLVAGERTMYDLTRYRHIDVRPVTGVVGAEIGGIDLSQPIDNEVSKELYSAFLDHHVIFFRDQELNLDQLRRFGDVFGTLYQSSYAPSYEGHQFLHHVVREAEAPSSRNAGDRWHVDLSADTIPMLGFGLYCLDAPDYGGDTLFANLCAAYEGLSEEMRSLCDRLILVHSMSGEFSGKSKDGVVVHKGLEKQFIMDQDSVAEYRKETHHPLVCVHPESGKKILFTAQKYGLRFKGMTEEESSPLLEMLNSHVTRPEFTCRFRWKRRSIAVADNRCLQHYALQDYSGFRREMVRFQLLGVDRPVGPATLC